ncbi:MAG: lipopolysaccharide biosynthesis protein [Desulfuromonadaceae bacterium]|nr:lipopolysaccharide biosynthesis protein [Desulfuromonadaceae bacterium]
MLKHKAKTAVVWSGIDQIISQGLGFVISVTLARLLFPEEFGTIALLSIFLGIADIFVNAGFSAALIQKQNVTHDDESTVFWFNVVSGVIFTGLLFALAPLLADFFKLPVLLPLTMLMACNVLVSSTSSVHRTLLGKRLDFKTTTKIALTSTVLSGCVAISMAWLGYGVWSLAGLAMVKTACEAVLLWHFSRWRPDFLFNYNSFRRLFGFGGYLFAANFVSMLYNQGSSLLIGKLFGTRDLGFFNRANSTQQMLPGSFSGLLSRVMFPVFSSVNYDKDRLKRGVNLSICSSMLIISPLSFGLAAVADPFTRVVFGDKWLPMVPIIQILCVGGLLYPMQLINRNILQAQGHGDSFLKIELVKSFSGVVLLIIGSIYGILGIAITRALHNILELTISTYYTGKYLDYGIFKQLFDCRSSIALSIGMAVIVFLADYVLNIGPLARLVVLCVLGASVYLAGNYLFGTSSFKNVVTEIRESLNRRSSL